MQVLQWNGDVSMLSQWAKGARDTLRIDTKTRTGEATFEALLSRTTPEEPDWFGVLNSKDGRRIEMLDESDDGVPTWRAGTILKHSWHRPAERFGEPRRVSLIEFNATETRGTHYGWHVLEDEHWRLQRFQYADVIHGVGKLHRRLTQMNPNRKRKHGAS